MIPSASPTEELRKIIVRVLNLKGATAGTGFLVSNDLIATCSHVLVSREDQQAGTARPSFLTVELFTGERLQAEICEGTWRPAHAEDVVLLRIKNQFSPDISVLGLGSSDGCEGHRFRTYGFPNVEGIDGLPDEGRIIGKTKKITKTAANISQVRLEAATVTGGFSGAPVFDIDRRRIIAMINGTLDRDDRGQVGGPIALPAETIRLLSNELVWSDVRPYQGLQSFGEAEVDRFYGRATEVARLIGKIRAAPRFVAVLGPSGSGKSSIIGAGVIPLISGPGTREWKIEKLRGDSRDLGPVLDEAARYTGPNRLLLIIDQFEEVFTSPDSLSAGDLLRRLELVLNSAGPITVLIAIRDEFFSKLPRESPGMAQWLEKGVFYIAPRLSRKDILDIIQEPAKLVGIPIELGLAERIADDATRLDPRAGVGESVAPTTILPLLEFTLDRLFDQRQDGWLVNSAYPPGGVASKLAEWASNTYYGLDLDHRPLARRLFTELIHVAGENEAMVLTRQRRRINELWNNESERVDIEHLISVFTDARLLATERTMGVDETVEIIHESLILTWSDLRDWATQRSEFLVWRAAVAPRVAQWKLTDKEDPLLRGLELSGLDPAFDEEMNAQERQFVAASRRAERSREEIERERRIESESRELAAAAFSQLPIDPELSLLLADEAVSRSATPEAYDALQSAVESSRVRQTITGHMGGVLALAFDPERYLLASGGADQAIHVWNLVTKKRLSILRSAYREVTSVAFSPDGTLIAAASLDGFVRFWQWDGEAASFSFEIKADPNGVNSLAFSSNGKLLVTGGEDTKVLVWDINERRIAATLSGFGKQVTAVAFSPDGQLVAAGSADRTARIWEVKAPQRLIFESPPFFDRVSSVVFSPDEKHIAVASYDSTPKIFLFRNAGDAPLTLPGSKNWMLSIAFDKKGDRVATCGADSVARIWNSHSGQLMTTLTGHKDAVTGIAFGPQTDEVATSSLDGTVRIWDIREIPDHLTVVSHDDAVVTAGFDRSGERLYTASWQTVRLWDPKTGEELQSSDGTLAAFDPDGTQLAVVRNDAIEILKLKPVGQKNSFPNIVSKLPGQGVWLIDIAYHPKGKQIATCGVDEKAFLWNLETGESIVLKGHRDWVNGLAYSPDGGMLATTSNDKTIKLWDTADGKELDTLSGHTHWIHGVCFDRSGSKLATASHDGTARLWDLTKRERTQTFEGHRDWIRDVDISLDGTRLATGSKDRSIRIWDVQSRQPVHVITDHADEVWRVAFSPDGSTLVSASWDRTARLWDVKTGKELRILRSHDSPSSYDPYCPDGIARLYRIKLQDLRRLAKDRLTREFTPWERQRFLHEVNASPGTLSWK